MRGHSHPSPHILIAPQSTAPSVKLSYSGGQIRVLAVSDCGRAWQVLKLLLGAGADVDLQAQNGCTALHNSAANGHDGCVEVLITVGCDVDVQNSGGNTALHVAATKGALPASIALSHPSTQR